MRTRSSILRRAVLGLILGIVHSLALAEETKIEESNCWPFSVKITQESPKAQSSQFLGPLGFSNQKAGESASGFRPFYFERHWEKTGKSESAFLYPIFVYRSQGDSWSWSVFNLINRSSPAPGKAEGLAQAFDLWPFYFSRQTGNPATSYRAVFPLYGTLKNRLGSDRRDWVLFPLYSRSQKGERVSTCSPWPFIQHVEGGNHGGFAVWPLIGSFEEKGKMKDQYLLWPFLFRKQTGLDQPEASLNAGFIPFYTTDRTPEYRSESFLWPFFGYTKRWAPYRYHETRLLWPLWVQGRGEGHHRNRWAPFYTYSEVKGIRKTWVLFPLFRQQRWTEQGLDQEKTQFLYFLYWSQKQRRAGSDENATVAEKVHVWPLLSAWDNGAGRKQVQLFSPLEVFFQHNDQVRLAYSPLFALYRFEQRGPGSTRHSLLWNAVSFDRDAAQGRRQFHLGPLFSLDKSPESGRVSLLFGLLGLRRAAAGQGWHFFAFDFNPRNSSSASQP
jgi:hypothetical protein